MSCSRPHVCSPPLARYGLHLPYELWYARIHDGYGGHLSKQPFQAPLKENTYRIAVQ